MKAKSKMKKSTQKKNTRKITKSKGKNKKTSTTKHKKKKVSSRKTRTKRMTKAQRKKFNVKAKKIMQYEAKPGYVGNFILLPVNSILKSDNISSSEKLIYGELFTIFNTTNRFQLNKQLLMKPLHNKANALNWVTKALHKFSKLGLISIVPVNTPCGPNSSRIIGYIVFNKGLNKISLTKNNTVKYIKSDKHKSKIKRNKMKPYINDANKVIDYLNKVTNKSRRYTKSNREHIIGRLREGYKLNDFYTVIDNQYRDWYGTKFFQFMRPSTLFIPSHFDDYLNNGPAHKPHNPNNPNNSNNQNNNGKKGYYGISF